jgi:hypothetical protein
MNCKACGKDCGKGGITQENGDLLCLNCDLYYNKKAGFGQSVILVLCLFVILGALIYGVHQSHKEQELMERAVEIETGYRVHLNR